MSCWKVSGWGGGGGCRGTREGPGRRGEGHTLLAKLRTEPEDCDAKLLFTHGFVNLKVKSVTINKISGYFN